MTNKFIQNIDNEIKPQKKEKLEEELLLNDLESLCEMAVHCDKNDQNGMHIVVGGTPWWERKKFGSNHKEHNPPHAHILWENKGKMLCSRFQIIDAQPPKSLADLKTVSESDIPLDSIADTLIQWAKRKPIRYKEKTNWEAMRSSWRDIQDYVNEGLKNPIVLQTLEDFEKSDI